MTTTAPVRTHHGVPRQKQQLCQALAVWLLDGSHHDTVPGSLFTDQPTVGGTDPAEIPDDGWSVSGMLYQLWDCGDRLPAEAAEILRLPAEATIGQAAQLLWWLRHAPRFGCCCYAEAIRLLQNLDTAIPSEL